MIEVHQLRKRFTQGRGATARSVLAVDGVSFTAADGRITGLLGPNGAGKTTTLRIAAALITPDAGRVQVDGIDVAARPTAALARMGVLSDARGLYPRLTARENIVYYGRLHGMTRFAAAARAEALAHMLDMQLLLDRRTDGFSQGERMKTALARALVHDPANIVLDEPTNGLDVLATRIVELDRARLRSYPGSFAAYEATKARELEDEALANVRADKLLAQEEVWVRQGVEARRTRSVGRVGRLLKLREQRAARRNVLGQVRLELDAGLPPGKIIAELKHVSMHFGEMVLIEDFSATILRGDKVGLIGPNGCGKTTLLKLILGELQPTRGSVRQGTRLQVAYFDQMRAALDLDATLGDTISPGSEWIEIGQPPKVTRKHVMSYLGDFLFAPERARAPVRTLSGGERNRLLLARLFALPANVLVLDEPTNDLDIDTLELLEELLQSYDGTVFLVSHDRRFLDNVVTSTIAWEGDPAWGGRPGLWREYEGGYEDWKRQRERTRVAVTAQAAAQASRPVATAAPPRPAAARTKLSYKEQRELEALPGRIEALEAEQKTLFERLAGSAVYTDEPHLVAGLQARHDAIEAELMAALERWEELAAR